jgi:hypothetical protein
LSRGRADEERDPGTTALAVIPFSDELSSNPGFHELPRQMNLTE